MASVRERNRINTMIHAQRTAMQLFTDHGFDEVSVEQIAEAADMSPSTIYRRFQTKEMLVVWDEHALDIDAAFIEQLRLGLSLSRIEAALVAGLGKYYDSDAEFQRRRVRMVFDIPAIHAAEFEQSLSNRDQLAHVLMAGQSGLAERQALVLASTALTTVDCALDEWSASDTGLLTDLLRDHFQALRAVIAADAAN